MKNEIIPFLIINALFLSAFIIGLLIFKRSNFNEKRDLNYEIKRKLIHFLVLILFFISTFILSKSLFLIVSIEFFISLIAIKWLDIPQSMKIAVDIKKNTGIFGLIAGLMIITNFFSFRYIQVSILILLISDAFAAIMGKFYPIKKFSIFDSTRSIMGSSIFLASTLIILIISTNIFGLSLNLNSIIIISLILTTIEILSKKGSDNFFLLIFTAIFLKYSLNTSLIICILYVLLYVLLNNINGKHYHNDKRS